MANRPKDFVLQLDPGSSDPLGLQVLKAVGSAIQKGRLKPGDSLPGSRQLAETLGVHRNTVLWALRELEAEGWVETRERFGTFVTSRPPELTLRLQIPGEAPSPERAESGFDLPAHLRPITTGTPTQMNLSEGLPDPRLAPAEALAKAYQRALRLHAGDLLKVGEAQGTPSLRAALSEMLSERRGMAVDPEQILITRGGRMALEILAGTLLSDGGAVAVENPGNAAMWEFLRQLPGVEVLPIPVDEEGMDIDALERCLQTRTLAAVFLTPSFHFPTTVSLSAPRRRQLLALAQKNRLAIIEDEDTAEYAYENPILPLASEDATGQVVYLGSLSKLLAPGISLGFVVGSKAMVNVMARVLRGMEQTGDRVLEWAVADLWRDGEISRHLRKANKIYRERRDLLAELIHAQLGPSLEVDLPRGGLAFWAKAMPKPDLETWVNRCRNRGLFFYAGSRYSFEGKGLPFVRMGFAALDATQMAEAVRRMVSALD